MTVSSLEPGRIGPRQQPDGVPLGVFLRCPLGAGLLRAGPADHIAPALSRHPLRAAAGPPGS
eukprot:227659-Alexandrium_andersonii.AAC.1